MAQGCTLQPHSRAAVQSHGARRQDRRQVSSHADVSQQRYSRACDWPPAAPGRCASLLHAQARFTFGCRSAQHYPKNYVMVLARYPLRYPSAVTSARDRRRRSASTSASRSYPSPTLTSRLNFIYLTRQARDPFPPSGRAAQSYRHMPKCWCLDLLPTAVHPQGKASSVTSSYHTYVVATHRSPRALPVDTTFASA